MANTFDLSDLDWDRLDDLDDWYDQYGWDGRQSDQAAASWFQTQMQTLRNGTVLGLGNMFDTLFNPKQMFTLFLIGGNYGRGITDAQRTGAQNAAGYVNRLGEFTNMRPEAWGEIGQMANGKSLRSLAQSAFKIGTSAAASATAAHIAKFGAEATAAAAAAGAAQAAKVAKSFLQRIAATEPSRAAMGFLRNQFDKLRAFSGRWRLVPGRTACVDCVNVAAQGDTEDRTDLAPIHPNAVLSGSTFVSYGDPVRMIASAYSGPSIVVHAGVKQVTIGPNHPMLTAHGLVPAKELREGDQLLYDLRADLSLDAHGESDLEEIPLVEDAFKTLSAVSSHAFVTAPSYDFHGDRVFCKGEVEVVWPERGLLSVLDPCDVEQLRQGDFMLTDAKLPLEASERTSLASFQRVCLPTPGRVSSSSVDAVSVSASPTPDGSSVDSPSAISAGIVHDHIVALTVTAVTEQWFDGWAYDASTAGLYLSNGFLCSNCDCTVAPIRRGGPGTMIAKGVSYDADADQLLDEYGQLPKDERGGILEWARRSLRLGGAMNLGTYALTGRDGNRWGVEKLYGARHKFHDVYAVDPRMVRMKVPTAESEALAARLARFVGALVPTSVPTDDNTKLLMDFAPGMRAKEYRQTFPFAKATHPGGVQGGRIGMPTWADMTIGNAKNKSSIRLGLLDYLVGNTDRNDGNFFITPSFQHWGIDFGLSEFTPNPIFHAGNLHVQPWVNFMAGTGGLPAQITIRDLEAMSGRLNAPASASPEIAALENAFRNASSGDRSVHLDMVRWRLENLIAKAKGEPAIPWTR